METLLPTQWAQCQLYPPFPHGTCLPTYAHRPTNQPTLTLCLANCLAGQEYSIIHTKQKTLSGQLERCGRVARSAVANTWTVNRLATVCVCSTFVWFNHVSMLFCLHHPLPSARTAKLNLIWLQTQICCSQLLGLPDNWRVDTRASIVTWIIEHCMLGANKRASKNRWKSKLNTTLYGE